MHEAEALLQTTGGKDEQKHILVYVVCFIHRYHVNYEGFLSVSDEVVPETRRGH